MAGFSFTNNIKTTDVAVALYMAITAMYMLIFGGLYQFFVIPLLIRLFAVLFIWVIIYIQKSRNSNWINFIHLFYPILMLSYFYGETSLINHFIFSKNLDPIIYSWEEVLFGFQPSIEFSIKFPQYWFSELLHFGYFSYYLLTIGVSITFYILRPALAEKVIFIIVTSFYIYYIVFIIFPVVGPQYYFIFPLNEVVDTGIFSRLVELIQYYGEHPTGAFPSSHVGMVVIFLYLSYGNIRWLFWVIIPLFILILLATVFIKAHYVVDVFAGIISAPIVYYLSMILFKQIKFKSGRL